MSDYVIGPGVLQAMAAQDPPDEPRSDEVFVVLDEGHKISRTYARDAIYYYYEEDNATRRTPF